MGDWCAKRDPCLRNAGWPKAARASSLSYFRLARALLVRAKDDGARAFYEHFTFEASPSDPYHLLLIMKDLMQMIDR
jgi:hypothetical protein